MPDYSLSDLRYLMKRLRDPETGCPWDRSQDFRSIAPYTVEEVYELIDTIERNDIEHLKEELGDVLFQLVFYSQLGEEQGEFDFDEVISTITRKLIARHPHVFPLGKLHDERSPDWQPETAQINATWETIKQQERESKGQKRLLDDIPSALPALVRADKLQKRAASTGFDWKKFSAVMEKLQEEIGELQEAISLQDGKAISDELGDLLFTCVNVARHLGVDAEQSLRDANNKFKRRFETLEHLAGNADLNSLSEQELDQLWNQAKTVV